MAVNTELLIKVNDWVQAENAKRSRGDDSEWNQESWACGTSCCFAGKVVLEAGGKFIFDNSLRARRCVLNGRNDTIAYAAAHILDIDVKDAEGLFSGGNDASDIDRYVQSIMAADQE